MNIQNILRKLRRELDWLTIVQLAISLSIIFIFLILPVFLLVVNSFYSGGTITFKWFERVLTSREYVSLEPLGGALFKIERTGAGVLLFIMEGYDYGIILNSILVALFVTIFASIIGLISALIIARYEFPGKNIFRILILVPLLATPFVNAFVVGKVLGRQGVLNFILRDILGLPYTFIVGGLVGIVIIQTLSFFPIIYLNMLSSLINIDPSMEEQAENLGARGFTLFRTITFPLSLPGLAAGATIVFIFSLEDLGAPIALKGAFADDLAGRVISYRIYQNIISTQGGILKIDPTTYALSVIMLLFAAIGFIAIKKYVSLKTYAMLSKGGRWSPRVRKLSWKGLILVYMFLVPVVIIASFPQAGVVLLAVTDWATSGAFPSTTTMKNLMALVEEPDIVRAIGNSLTYSAAAVFVIVLVGTSTAYVVARKRLPGIDILDIIVTIPIAVPGIIVAVGYFILFSQGIFSGTPFDIFENPGLLLIFSYTVRRLPFTARAVFAGLQQTHVSLEEASLSLGASRVQTFARIVIPLIAANIIGGGILSFVYCMSEVSTSITLASFRPEQGPITHYMSSIIGGGKVGVISYAASLGVLLMTAQIISMAVSNWILKQRVAFLGV